MNQTRDSNAEIGHLPNLLDWITKIIHKIFYIIQTNILYSKAVIRSALTSAQSDSEISSRIPKQREIESSTFSRKKHSK